MSIPGTQFTRPMQFLMPLLLVLFLQACGFQLRGALEMSQGASPLYLQQNGIFELARDLKQQLATNKIALTKNVSRANSQLILSSEKKQRRVLSVDTNGRVREYLLIYTVDFSVSFKSIDDRTANVIPETITVSRTLLFDLDAVLAVTNESEILYEDMRRETARLILLKLQALSADLSTITKQ